MNVPLRASYSGTATLGTPLQFTQRPRAAIPRGCKSKTKPLAGCGKNDALSLAAVFARLIAGPIDEIVAGVGNYFLPFAGNH